MADNETELVDEARSFGEYNEKQISDPDILTAISRAKKHLDLEAEIPEDLLDWYGDDTQEEALFWTTLLFTKVQTQALDAKAVSVGALNESVLLANGDQTVFWYERYEAALGSLVAKFTENNRVGRSNRTSGTGSTREYDTPTR